MTKISNWEEVIQYLEKAKKLSNDSRIDEMMIMTLYKANQYDQCSKVCRKVVLKNPNSLAAQKSREVTAKIKKNMREKDKPDKPKKVENSKEPNLSLEEALEALHSLIGLNDVKEQIEKLRRQLEFDLEYTVVTKGNNYFKLRDLAEAFGITVTWDEATSAIGIDTSL